MSNINLKPKASFKKDDQVRMYRTIKFLGDKCKGVVLDIGNKNPIGDFMAEYYKVKKYNTYHDLNFFPSSEFNKTINTVWCFEIIEHLVNPLLFLWWLNSICNKKTRIFLTYPIRPRLFWARTHFHEYDKKRFRYMLKCAGYKIVRYQQRTHWRPDWWFYLSGIRPFLRLTIGRCKQQFYELKIE
jgi:hypothetical protein